MSGHRSLGKLTKEFSPERKFRIAAKAAALREEMTLQELREGRDLSQYDIAATLLVEQSAVAEYERRSNIGLGSLKRYVEALGGTLEITARFADTSVVISDIGEPAA